MGQIIVCPLRRLEQVVADSGAGAVLTLLNPPLEPPRLKSVAPERHLILSLSDIVAPREGHVLAGLDHVESLLAFVRAWDRSRPLVVHCYAGVSRSPAAAFIAACALTPRRELEIAQTLRRLSPSATPNPHLVALADSLLVAGRKDGRGGGIDRARGRMFRGRNLQHGSGMNGVPHPSVPVEIGLTAAIVAVRGDAPLILVARGARSQDLAARNEDMGDGVAALPSGPFDPIHHRTFEMGLRAWVAEQTGVPVGYVEQLYTFGDRGRHSRADSRDPHEVSVGYLALTRIRGEDWPPRRARAFANGTVSSRGRIGARAGRR